MSQTIYINYLRLRANALYVNSVFKSPSTTHEGLLSGHTITKLYEMERIWELHTALGNGIWRLIQKGGAEGSEALAGNLDVSESDTRHRQRNREGKARGPSHS